MAAEFWCSVDAGWRAASDLDCVKESVKLRRGEAPNGVHSREKNTGLMMSERLLRNMPRDLKSEPDLQASLRDRGRN